MAAETCAAVVHLVLAMAVMPLSGTVADAKAEIKPLISAPSERSQWDAWRRSLSQVRQPARQEIGYSDALYGRDEFAWVPSCYNCRFAMMYDQTFYDPVLELSWNQR